ncbi:unnamed protein product [Chilo suppressalis]|uniref:Uncharacterized protein n=1 Tax=Chilo suppressalis TaxID=168631 RepID=A0ABN8BGA8_CHISP|nr:hypothetical protein evm_005323 [Chilo suppressalis]CAH0406548.1 unnamed protein product [Chilo suppressalis]
MEAMELAGQWRREWAGTAEYGKVTEGGVTRQVARAMEVLNASAPGARVRVMRAAYHSTSGPGVPASSYMLHSSRRVISSGFNLLESPSFQEHSTSKPLEISSTPLDHLPDTNTETENYKVTEPDDIEISEPSKWRSASDKSSLRMPSEESSSTENASIIDLDSRFSHKGLNRKYSYDSESSINSFKRSSSRTSPLLDAPATLSTLKFKSLLNDSNDWNIRRKSYSFEDTSPLNEVILHSNDTLAMESSTDSGICKSSEIVNDFAEEARKGNVNCGTTRETVYTGARSSEELKKNRFSTSPNFRTYKEHYVVKQEPRENNIALQSRGKVSITVPITIEDDDYNMNNNQIGEDGERKVKKVGFCKTELHFAADSGKVNIIATDDKPPPTNDFRKRRSAFVPINEKFEKPITLFGEKSDFLEIGKIDEYGIRSFHEAMELDENTAATKSILKNRIPKPKPYLLGENMAFGNPNKTNLSDEEPAPTGVSIINKQLQRKRNDTNEPSLYSLRITDDMSFRDSLRTTNKGPSKVQSSDNEKHIPNNDSTLTKKASHSNWNNTKVLQMTPVQKPKTRQLRENELTYFGIDNQQKKDFPTAKSHGSLEPIRSQSRFPDDTFESVRLIKQISNSAQNSEAESDDSPDYQNFPIKSNFAPIPTPRTRVKYKNSDERITILKPIVERASESIIASQESRRSRRKKQEDVLITANRSLSEPPKKQSESSLRRQDELRHSSRQDNILQRYSDQKKTKEKTLNKNTDKAKTNHHTDVDEDKNLPLYANVTEEKDSQEHNSFENRLKPVKGINSLEKTKEHRTSKCESDSLKKKQNSIKKTSRSQRTEKLSTPEYSTQQKRSDSAKKPYKDDRRDLKDNKCDIVKTSRRTNTDENNESEKDVTLSKDKSSKERTTNHRPKQSLKSNTRAMESAHKKMDPIIIEHATKSKDLREVDRMGADKNYHSNGRRTGRRSEYVIKYDDKNGTVSSVSKVRTGHSAVKQKHTLKERSKNNIKDLKTKDKNVDVSALRNAAPRSSQACERKKRI